MRDGKIVADEALTGGDAVANFGGTMAEEPA
jgi:hypothetical protein